MRELRFGTLREMLLRKRIPIFVVSFAVRGSGSYLAEVITEDKTLKRITFTPGTDWKRIEVPFQPLPDAPAFGLHLRGNGTVWLESFRPAPSSERGYQLMAANGVASAFPELAAYKPWIAFVIVCILTWGNLRGMRESAIMFGVPT